MNNRTALDTLQQLAQRETDGAARQLTVALDQQTSAKQRLDMLLELRAEYAERLLRQSREGMSIAAIKNFQAFMEKIDDAIAGQTRLAASASTRVEQANAGWQAKKRAEKTWESLIKRDDRANLLKEQRQDRKLMDEYASRAARRQMGDDGAN